MLRAMHECRYKGKGAGSWGISQDLRFSQALLSRSEEPTCVSLCSSERMLCDAVEEGACSLRQRTGCCSQCVWTRTDLTVLLRLLVPLSIYHSGCPSHECTLNAHSAGYQSSTKGLDACEPEGHSFSQGT